MPCYSPLKGWKDRESGGIIFKRGNGSEKMEVACGQCLGCRLDHSRMWAMRIVHESAMHEHDGGNCFITLTYRDKSECTDVELHGGFHVPDDWSLHMKHFQDFMKRLRKFYSPQKVRFFHCGEYGSKCKHGIQLDLVKCPLCRVGRPHYHACLFNCDFPDLESYGSNDGDLRYTSKTLESLWKYGFVDVGELNFTSAAYVARYVMKKVTGKAADDHYMQCDMDGVATWVQKEYITMSRRPGIGKTWFDIYKDDVFPSDEVPVPGSGVFKKVPRFYEEIFAEENPMSMEAIHNVRERFMIENKDEYSPERLFVKYNVKKAQIKNLQRSL